MYTSTQKNSFRKRVESLKCSVRFQLSSVMDEKIYLFVFVAIVGLVASIANLLMIHVLIVEKKLKKPSHLIILSLQIVDLLIFIDQIFRLCQVF